MSQSKAYQKGWQIMPDDTKATPAVRKILSAERESLQEDLENAESEKVRQQCKGALDKINSILS